MSGEPVEFTIDAMVRASFKRAMTERLGEILDFWVRGFLAGLIEGAKMSNTTKGIAAMGCTFRRVDFKGTSSDSENGPVGDWEQGIAVAPLVSNGGMNGLPVVIDLDGKPVETVYEVRLQFYGGRVVAHEGSNVAPEEWPKPEDLAGGVPADAALESFGLRMPRHNDFVTLVSVSMLATFDARVRGMAAMVVAHAMNLKHLPEEGDLLEQAEAFARYLTAANDSERARPEWLHDDDEMF